MLVARAREEKQESESHLALFLFFSSHLVCVPKMISLSFSSFIFQFFSHFAFFSPLFQAGRNKVERATKLKRQRISAYTSAALRKSSFPFSETLLPLRHRPSTCEPQFLFFRDSSFLVLRTTTFLGFPSRAGVHALERAVFRLFHPPLRPLSVPFSSLPWRPWSWARQIAPAWNTAASLKL